VFSLDIPRIRPTWMELASSRTGNCGSGSRAKERHGQKMRADVSRSHFVVDLGFKASAYLLPTIIRVGHNQLLAPREELKTSGIT